jgi:polyphosphate kinase
MSPKPVQPLGFREVSWLEFNARVLDEARDPTVPLLERVKFIAIFSSNLDEFFMVRYAELWRAIDAEIQHYGPNGEHPRTILKATSKRVRELVALQHHVLLYELIPALERQGIVLARISQLSAEQLAFLEDYFERELHPILTPVAIDPGHPFPYLSNKNLALLAELDVETGSGPLPAPSQLVVPTTIGQLPRFIQLPNSQVFVTKEDIIRYFLYKLIPGCRIRSVHALRVTRDAELEIRDSEDLMSTVEEAVRKRRQGQAVRLQHETGLPGHLVQLLKDELRLDPEDIYAAAGFVALTDLFQLYNQINRPEFKDPYWPPAPVPAFDSHADPFSAIRAGDILLHHPYQDFSYVTRFIQAAARDPQVIAIKMTLYRTSGESPIAKALSEAAQNGKQVAVLVELRARFNEESNIAWARHLEDAGAHVVYGIVGFKTHCKAAMVVRRESDGLKRYCHLGTGNYNDQTARFYTDLGLFTCNNDFSEDLTRLFNLLTGYARPDGLVKLVFAPLGLREHFCRMIEREIEHLQAGRPAGIRAKLNALTDPVVIRSLYTASQAGVPITLIVRGICVLEPAVPGWSESIQVISIIDRYLEHARIYAFKNGGMPEYWLSSADWMNRNLQARVEVAFPILEPELQQEIENILQIQCEDNTKARILLPGSVSIRKVQGSELLRAQSLLSARAWRQSGA